MVFKKGEILWCLFCFWRSSTEILPSYFAKSNTHVKHPIVILRKRNRMHKAHNSKGEKAGEGYALKVYQSELVEKEEGKGMIKGKHE